MLVGYIKYMPWDDKPVLPPNVRGQVTWPLFRPHHICR